MWRTLLACSAAAGAFGLWEAAAQSAPEADPARWTLGAGSVPMEVAQLAGGLHTSPQALDLWSYRVASPRLPPFAEGVVELRARVPTDGQLTVRFGADEVRGPTLPVRPAGAAPPGRPPVGPVGAGAPPGASRGAGILIDRGARNGIFGRGITCDPAPAPAAEAFALRIDAHAGDLAVSIDGKPVTRCHGGFGPGALVLGGGVRRVQVDAVTVTPAGGPPLVEDFGGPLRSVWLGVGMALVAGFGSFFTARRGPRPWALALSPLLLLPVLGRVGLRGALDACRMMEVPEALGPLVFAGIPALFFVALIAGATAPTLASAARRGLVPLALTGALVLALARSAPDAPGWAVLAATLLPLAALAWVNTHPFPRRVPASWALSALFLGGAEGGLRLTALGENWSATAGWKRASEEFSELLEIRQYRAYPDEGFPVRPPEPDPSRRRIVALGGSSTGGAYQMDDIDQFWPKRLEERLAGTDWQVVNQGVGGWNTLHIRLYLESQVERLDGDIYALYVGHNDILSPAPVPYRELYAGWRQPDSTVRAVSHALHEVRLYVGLKYAIFGLLGARSSVAVPVPDARENVAAIIATAKAHGAHVLLVNEGLNPDPYPMRPYGEMLAALAASTDSAYLDAATAFASEDPDLFIDDCHLSVEGHTKLASWVYDALAKRGWL